MNERICESLSALMDDEANELELERLLSQVGSDPQLRHTWMRYHLANHAVRGDQLAHQDWDISARVQSALHESQSTRSVTALKHRLMRPLISVGVAASVALTVVIAGQQLSRISETNRNGNNEWAYRSPVGAANVSGASAQVVNFGLPSVPVLQPATHTAYQDLAQQRQRRYMQAHAEQAALNTPQGLIPFARVPEIRK